MLLTSVNITGFGSNTLDLVFEVLSVCSPREHLQAKKVVEHGFDKSPVHGLGRGKSANWWKSLADQLLVLGKFFFSLL